MSDAATVLLMNSKTNLLEFAGKGFIQHPAIYTSEDGGRMYGRVALEREMIHISDLRKDKWNLIVLPCLYRRTLSRIGAYL
jgi:hypothetical protein